MASALSVGQIAGLLGGSSLLSFGGNLATSAINSSRAWKYAQRAMDYQDYLNRNLMADYYKINRKSLETAGYNPLLALGSGAQGAVYSGSGINSDSDNGSQSVEAGINSALMGQDLVVKDSQKSNIDADTDIKKFGTKGAILKNLVNLADKNKDNPMVQKIVDAQITKMNPQFSHSAIDSNFYNNHPTTATVLRKLKQGDFRGAKYAMDLRRERIKKELNGSHSSISALKKVKFDDSLNYANSQKAPSPNEIRGRKTSSYSGKYTNKKVVNLPSIT